MDTGAGVALFFRDIKTVRLFPPLAITPARPTFLRATLSSERKINLFKSHKATFYLLSRLSLSGTTFLSGDTMSKVLSQDIAHRGPPNQSTTQASRTPHSVL